MFGSIQVVWRDGKRFVNGVEMDNHELAALMASRGIKFETVEDTAVRLDSWELSMLIFLVNERIKKCDDDGSPSSKHTALFNKLLRARDEHKGTVMVEVKEEQQTMGDSIVWAYSNSLNSPYIKPMSAPGGPGKPWKETAESEVADELKKMNNFKDRLLRIISGGADCSLCGAVGDEPCLDERGEPIVADAWHVARCAKTTNEPVEGTSPPIISTSWDNHTADIKLDILRIDEMMRAEHQKQQDMMREHLTKIQQRIWGNREEILTAFVAKYGPVDPLDVVQITTQELYWPYGTKWMLYLRNKTDEEKIAPPSLFPPRKSEYGQSEILVTKHGVYSDLDFIIPCDDPDDSNIPCTD